MKSAFLALILVFAFSGLAQAQSQPTVMELIAQTQLNNAVLKVATDANTVEIKALRAELKAEREARQASDAKLDQIHIAIVRNQSLITAPSVVEVVAPPGRSMAMQGPAGGMMMESHGGMGMAGACSGGSCGSGRGRMVARMRSR